MPRAPGPRRRGGRYAPRYDPIELLTIVREITLLAAASGVSPLLVTTRAYDAARANSPYPDSPRADRIASFFNAPWRRVVEVSHLTGRAFQQSVVALTRREEMPFTREEAAAALTAIAARLGVRVLRPLAYDEELDRLVEEQRRAWLHGRRVWDEYPSSRRIDKVYGWAAIHGEAGLDPLPRTVPPVEERHPRWTWTCVRCVESLLIALDEYAAAAPGKLLSQRAYARLQKGRSELAPMSSITAAAVRMGTSVGELRQELIAWRLGPRQEEPACFEVARQVDAEQARMLAHAEPFAEARAWRRRQRAEWEEELLRTLREFGRPIALREIVEKTGWRAGLASERLRSLHGDGLVTMTNIGRGTKTARWSAAAR